MISAASATPQNEAPSWQWCALIIALSAAVALAIHIPNYLHQDVAFLAWTMDHVLRGAVFGRDIYDINPPLNFMIYLPAVLLGKIVGLDLAIKLSTVALAAVSMTCVWLTAEKSIRLQVVAALGIFFALAFPREFGQREQFALLLTAPYVAGHTDRRGLALLNGVMAGIGFALKPYFLVPLLLVFLTRRKIRTEEWAIGVTGLIYAASLLLFFQPYLTEFLPRTAANYWLGKNRSGLILKIGFLVPTMVPLLYWIAAPQKGVAGYAMAAVGFFIAVFLHQKGFPYHFIPCFGYLAMFLAAMLENKRPLARIAASMFFTLVTLRMLFFAVPWFLDAEGRRPIVPALLEEINKSSSFTVLSGYNFPAFPTAILTETPFVGLSSVNNFISTVTFYKLGFLKGDSHDAEHYALEQAILELQRKPQLVIVDTDWSGPANIDLPFDGLAWFDSDPRFHALWQNYELTGQFQDYQFYRLKQ